MDQNMVTLLAVVENAMFSIEEQLPGRVEFFRNPYGIFRLHHLYNLRDCVRNLVPRYAGVIGHGKYPLSTM